MVSEDSPTSRLADRYSSLFTLPSLGGILTFIFALCLIGGSSMLISKKFSLLDLSIGLSLGAFMFFTILFTDLLNSRVFMRKDPVFNNLRRCSFLSIPSSSIVYVSAVVANLVGTSTEDLNLWIKIVSTGFFVALTLRLFVLSTVSSVSYGETFFSALLQPSMLLSILSIQQMSEYEFRLFYLLPPLVSILLGAVGVYIFVSSVDTAGEEVLGIRSFSLFKAFLANWTENLNKPLEHFFEKIGEETEIKVSLLAFKTNKEFKAAIIIPTVHPGPFNNVGSSLLPYMIQTTLENKLKCVVSAPHGISGHDLDLASHLQNERVLSRVAEIAEFETFDAYATPFARSEVDNAKASCQIFGDCALLTLTLAPETMEDLPRELEDTIINEAKKRGLATAVTIDAHNSIQGPFDPEKAMESLRKAAVNALEKALGYEQRPVEVGEAKINPQEFSINDGMGPGGISVIIIKVDEQKTAYVTIDGNNMVSNLREKILSRLKDLGINEGEILTTDTHVVNGIVKIDRGYYPVGEAVNQDKLIDYITSAASEALRNLEPAEFSWRVEKIPNIKIIGEKQLNNLSLLADRTIERVKKVVSILFPTLAVLFAAILILL